MNPFTRSLLKQLNNHRLHRFVVGWDRLETLIIQAYKTGSVSPEDEAVYRKTQIWLRARYPRWKTSLSRYWQGTRAGGKPLETDPFETLLSIQEAREIPGNWLAMQTLPAARQALNQFLLDEIGE